MVRDAENPRRDGRFDQLARSLLKFAEPVELRRFKDAETEGGYATEQYHDPEEIDVILRPGDIDVPFVGKMGQEGTQDLWMIAPTEVEIGEDDRIIPRRGYGFDGYSEQEFGQRSEFEASMPKGCNVNGVEVYQLNEVDGRS